MLCDSSDRATAEIAEGVPRGAPFFVFSPPSKIALEGCVTPERSSGSPESNLFDCTGFFNFRRTGRSICNTDMESPTVARRASSIERVKDDANEKGLCRNSARRGHDGRQHGLQYPPPELQCLPKPDRLPSLQHWLAEGWNRLRALPWFSFPSAGSLGTSRARHGWPRPGRRAFGRLGRNGRSCTPATSG